jgi:hypothetical protein
LDLAVVILPHLKGGGGGGGGGGGIPEGANFGYPISIPPAWIVPPTVLTMRESPSANNAERATTSHWRTRRVVPVWIKNADPPTEFVINWRADVVWSIDAAEANANARDNQTDEYNAIFIRLVRLTLLGFGPDFIFLFNNPKKRMPKKNKTPALASRQSIIFVWRTSANEKRGTAPAMLSESSPLNLEASSSAVSPVVV